MNQEEIYSVWASETSIWSRWVAPVLFAQADWSSINPEPSASPQRFPWLEKLAGDTALIVDLPGAGSVEFGFSAAASGFRPIPLYNSSPAPSSSSSASIDMHPIEDAISRLTAPLHALALPEQAPPAFLLDSVRLVGTTQAMLGFFDNRWMVVPQDFPSANFLIEHGIQRVLLIQKERFNPQEDLAHCLLRWQDAGIKVLSKGINDDLPPQEITVKRPSRYRSLWYRALAQLGFRRNSVGGFGSYIPEPTSAG